MPLTKKIILIGDPEVGKTSLIRRYVLNEFSDEYIVTIGVKVSKKSIEFGLGTAKSTLNMIIYDILGQHDFRAVRDKYISGANGAIIVMDLSRIDTIDNVQNFWLPEIKKKLGDIPKIFLGNKMDLVNGDTTAKYLLDLISGATSFPYQLCSAKSGEGVNEGFKMMAEILTGLRKATETENGLIERPPENIRSAVDSIIRHFCDSHKDPDKAIERCSAIFEEMGFNLQQPKNDLLLQIINRLADEESSYLDQKHVVRNRLERVRLLTSSRK